MHRNGLSNILFLCSFFLKEVQTKTVSGGDGDHEGADLSKTQQGLKLVTFWVNEG